MHSRSENREWALIDCASINFGLIWKNECNYCIIFFYEGSIASVIGIFLFILCLWLSLVSCILGSLLGWVFVRLGLGLGVGGWGWGGGEDLGKR